MHLAVVIFTMFAVWRWGDWKNWQKYHTTMLFMAIGNLLYNFIYKGHLLWELKPDFLYNHTVSEFFYSFIVFPCTALLLLSDYPQDIKNKMLKIFKFIIIYIWVEYIFFKFERIVYGFGWNIWWSLAWDIMMFPVIMLHHKRPLAAYGVSFLVVLLVVVVLFPVPANP